MNSKYEEETKTAQAEVSAAALIALKAATRLALIGSTVEGDVRKGVKKLNLAAARLEEQIAKNGNRQRKSG